MRASVSFDLHVKLGEISILQLLFGRGNAGDVTPPHPSATDVHALLQLYIVK